MRCGTPDVWLMVSGAGSRLRSHSYDRWRQTGLLPAPDRGVDGFQITGEPRAIEQRFIVTVARELGRYGVQSLWIARQRQGQFFIFRQRLCHHFGQAERPQQAGADASGESIAETGDDRKTGPESVTGRGMGITRNGIQEQI